MPYAVGKANNNADLQEHHETCYCQKKKKTELQVNCQGSYKKRVQMGNKKPRNNIKNRV